MKCILCGRPTEPAVLLAGKAVGPKCAARAGLLERAKKGRGQLLLVARRRERTPEAQTLDLFAEVAA